MVSGTPSSYGGDGTDRWSILANPPPVDLPASVRQIFTEQLDLSLRGPFEELLTYLHSVAENPQDKHRLTTWLEIIAQGNDNPDSIALRKTLTDNFMSVVDLLEEFPSTAIDLAHLLELLPPQKPRLYSISSSSLLFPQHIQITVRGTANQNRCG